LSAISLASEPITATQTRGRRGGKSRGVNVGLEVIV
jgi:hypothetical protein